MCNKEMDMEIVKNYALSFVGIKYFYGGDDPISGWDCSGYAGEILMAFGIIPHGTKHSAQMLYDRIESNSSVNIWGLGALSFYGKSVTQISHVGFCLDQFSMTEAGGGDSTTITQAVASSKNAFVRIRPIKYRKDLLVVLKPNYASIGYP